MNILDLLLPPCSEMPSGTEAGTFDASVLSATLETNDPEILQVFYEMFLELADETWQQLEARPPLPAIRRPVRRLREASSSIGAFALADLLQTLEDTAALGDLSATHELLEHVGSMLANTCRAVSEHIMGLESSAATSALSVVAEAEPRTEPLFDPEVLPAGLETKDPEVLRKFYSLFLTVAEDTWQQLAIHQTVPDKPQVRHLAHKLKSSSASVGAIALALGLQRLEHSAACGHPASISEELAQAGELLSMTCQQISQHLDATPAGERA